MLNRITGEKGFTLVEIITSIAVLVLVFLAFLPIIPQSIYWSNTAKDQIEAGHLLGRVAYDIQTQPEQLGIVPGSESESSVHRYAKPVALTVEYDNYANLYAVRVEVFGVNGERVASSYVYMQDWGDL